MKYTLSLFITFLFLFACTSSNNASGTSIQQYTGIDYIGIATLIITMIGWVVTAYFQGRILDRQKQADKDIKSLEFAQKIALSKREQKHEILPQARMKMINAFSRVSALGSRAIQFPDLNSWASDQLNEWVTQLDFMEFQKKELLNSVDKNKYYLKTRFLYDAKEVTDSVADLQNFLVQNKLFIDGDLLAEFEQVLGNLDEITNGIIYARRAKDDSVEAHFVYKLGMEVSPLINKIENMIVERLNQNFPLES